MTPVDPSDEFPGFWLTSVGDDSSELFIEYICNGVLPFACFSAEIDRLIGGGVC